MLLKRYLVDHTFSAVTIGPSSEAAAEGASEAQQGQAVAVERIQLDCGASLLLQADHRLPKVHLRAVMLGGPVYETVSNAVWVPYSLSYSPRIPRVAAQRPFPVPLRA